MIVAAAVVVLHLVLHPLSNKINKLRSYDKEKRAKDECMYKISVTCLDNFEVDIRAHLMSALKDARDIILHNLESSETDDGNTKSALMCLPPRRTMRPLRMYLTALARMRHFARRVEYY